jgi:hypothetical protein
MNSVHLTVATLLLASLCLGQTPPQTTITNIKDQIVSSPFDQDTPLVRKKSIHGWSAAIGQWQVKDGVLHGDEVAEDNHASSCTWKLDATNLVISAEFRLGTAAQIAFGCRDNVPPHHHLGRTFISKEGIWIVHQTGLGKTTKTQKLKELKTPIDPASWHRITIEISGDHYRAQVDDHVVEGRHPRYQDSKGLVALITKGQGAQFKNVTIWHADPKS